MGEEKSKVTICNLQGGNLVKGGDDVDVYRVYQVLTALFFFIVGRILGIRWARPVMLACSVLTELMLSGGRTVEARFRPNCFVLHCGTHPGHKMGASFLLAACSV